MGQRRKVDQLGPTVDRVNVQDMCFEDTYEVTTDDGWTLVVTRFIPIPQMWHQPLLNQPILCVHGFSQNRFSWTTGEFVKNMAYFGADIHILELRGHGRSSRDLQREKAREQGVPLPSTIDYDWSFDHYFLYDVPAAIEKVLEVSGHEKIFYCGHSMGGMIGYGLAATRSDIAGMVTIGSPADLGYESGLLRIASAAAIAFPALDLGIDAFNATRRVEHKAIRAAAKFLSKLPILNEPLEAFRNLDRPQNISAKVVPMDVLLRAVYRFTQLTDKKGFWIPRSMRIFNPLKHHWEDLEWVLRQGGEKEPVAVLKTFISWINHREMKCYTNGFDFHAGFKNITIPITIVFGDEDFLAGVRSTRKIYNQVRSNYVVWRPVRGNGHLEITMGKDIRQICYDIKNLIEYALTHQTREPRLPRFRAASKSQ